MAQRQWQASDIVRTANYNPSPCGICSLFCQGNGGVGVDPPLNGHTDIRMYTDSTAYMNQDLECQVSSGPSAFLRMYLVNRGQFY